MARIRKFNPKWLLIALVIACVIGVSVGGYFALNKATPTATIPQQPVQPNPVPPAVPATPSQITPNPEKVLFARDLGSAFWEIEKDKYISYGLGFLGTPPGNTYPLYDFPLFISRSVEGGPDHTIATIVDPNLTKIGDVWESTLIKDVDYSSAFEVRLIRVDTPYKYKVNFFVSPDGGEHWFSPLNFPPD